VVGVVAVAEAVAAAGGGDDGVADVEEGGRPFLHRCRRWARRCEDREGAVVDEVGPAAIVAGVAAGAGAGGRVDVVAAAAVGQERGDRAWNAACPDRGIACRRRPRRVVRP